MLDAIKVFMNGCEVFDIVGKEGGKWEIIGPP
jgi:hypothetical protein